MTHGSEWTLKCDEPEVENVARGRIIRSFDNDKRHVTAFRPISEAAGSWSYDNIHCVCAELAAERAVQCRAALVRRATTACSQ